MSESNIITGKISIVFPNSGNENPKKLYIKVFPGLFSMKAPKPKKAKVLVGELLVRYSSREWLEKKHGPIVGSEIFLNGLSTLLSEVNLVNSADISWDVDQRELKETVTIKVGTKLAQEMLDRGMASMS